MWNEVYNKYTDACNGKNSINGFISFLNENYLVRKKEDNDSDNDIAIQVLREYVDFKDPNGNETVSLLPVTIIDAMLEFESRVNGKE